MKSEINGSLSVRFADHHSDFRLCFMLDNSVFLISFLKFAEATVQNLFFLLFLFGFFLFFKLRRCDFYA